jgi:hypothetical protein
MATETSSRRMMPQGRVDCKPMGGVSASGGLVHSVPDGGENELVGFGVVDAGGVDVEDAGEEALEVVGAR